MLDQLLINHKPIYFIYHDAEAKVKQIFSEHQLFDDSIMSFSRTAQVSPRDAG